MEDYQAAFLERHIDTETLHPVRKVGAMHFGGVTIECLLKAMILANLPRDASREWKTNSNNPGHTIKNPGHKYDAALRRHNRLRSRIERFPDVMEWLNTVENPMSQHFIDMRYSGREPDDESYEHWFDAYQNLRQWLLNQIDTL
ncbi:hypothetical protein [Nodularia sp. NIES-3585]|uniref:hypothetical protein n=1 Tax=Nodularia sp. NIES-3585 TaxID=1973477 RepID=UPI000B5C33C1|nr:hypothetical protein [Nodularia sp. NIES-3585]GAX35899.1 hypothetical protein NIES3585_19180 [Nodularia sp. NIES-3585]